MIRVESITINEFRGIRKLTINFKGKNYAICGPNGTGKSGIVDALEFGLTGSISRLSGQGTGGISVKEHAPHVDSRNDPDKAVVTVVVTIPKLGKTVTIVRSVKNPTKPTITPNDASIAAVLHRFEAHSEFVLSRRELIRYVIATAGQRAEEVQALLRLDQVEQVRQNLQKIANSCDKAVKPLGQEQNEAASNLNRALGIPQLNPQAVIVAVNARRTTLGLVPLTELTATTTLKDGLVTVSAAAQSNKVAKVQALADIKRARELLKAHVSAEANEKRTKIVSLLDPLTTHQAILRNLAYDRFLQNGLEFITTNACPLCGVSWEPEKLRVHIREKQGEFKEISKKRKEVEQLIEPLVASKREIVGLLDTLSRYGKTLTIEPKTLALGQLRAELLARCQKLQDLLPLDSTIALLREKINIPTAAMDAVDELEKCISALPEPTQQDAAREYLTVGQERLDAYRGVSRRLLKAQNEAKLTRKVFDTYVTVSTRVLDGIYKVVEKDFVSLYRAINQDDESTFEAQLTPSLGKLGFDVDFYGRGFFPPGAYHSEGHQDGMGVCLYLALMRHLLGDDFTFAVLDDVLMSVDSGHRREVCALLKSKFPDTQFILTTHDPIWLKHMKSAGLIASDAAAQFRTWHVDHGPSEWDEKDVWAEIADDLKNNDVRAAAALLRHYLEYVSGEICHRLRARVEFRGDAQFQLGDLLPNAVSRLRELYKEGKAVADSWKRPSDATAITLREKALSELSSASNVEQWQINAAVHYNQWATLHPKDFKPVAESYQKLIEHFRCGKCNGLLRIIPERGPKEALRCDCSDININLVKA